MSRLDQRGTALVAVLGLAVILLPVGAFVTLRAQTDILIERNLRRELATFYAAEAGLEHAVAEIAPGQTFADLLAGPDHVAGTKDDGVFPFRTAPPAFFPQPPLRYAVEVMPVRDGLVRITSLGSGESESVSTLEALVARAPGPFTPAAFFSEVDPSRMVVGDDFWLSGWDHRLNGGVVEHSGAAPALPAFASPSEDGMRVVRQQLAAAGDHVEGVGASPSVATALRLGVEAYATRLAQHPVAVHLAPLPEPLASLGIREQPQLTVIDGDLQVAGHLAGAGALVIRGSLRVTGTLDFAGLVIVTDGIVFDSSSVVMLMGALWRAASVDDRLELRGGGGLRYDSQALAAVDRALPGVLPHAATVVGWQEHL